MQIHWYILYVSIWTVYYYIISKRNTHSWWWLWHLQYHACSFLTVSIGGETEPISLCCRNTQVVSPIVTCRSEPRLNCCRGFRKAWNWELLVTSQSDPFNCPIPPEKVSIRLSLSRDLLNWYLEVYRVCCLGMSHRHNGKTNTAQ